jgi:hypothetical protein
VFNRYRIQFASGAYSPCPTWEQAQALVQSQVDLQEVPINSKIGIKILKQMGVDRSRPFDNL